MSKTKNTFKDIQHLLNHVNSDLSKRFDFITSSTKGVSLICHATGVAISRFNETPYSDINFQEFSTQDFVSIACLYSS